MIGLWKGGAFRRWLSVKVQPWSRPGGRVEGAVASFADVTEDQQVRKTLQFKAFHDALTGLPNREVFRDRLEQALNLMDRSEHGGVAVLFLDLDRFKEINDTWGHAAGDRMLEAVAQRIDGQLRSHDTLARLSGDEFVILLREVDSEDAVRKVVERVYAALAAPVEVDRDVSLAPEVSIGIALHRDGPAVAEDLLERADQALYDAKRAGRNTYRFGSRVRAES